MTVISFFKYSSLISVVYIYNDYKAAEYSIDEQQELALEAFAQLQQLNAAE